MLFKFLKKRPKVLLGKINLKPNERVRTKDLVDSKLVVTKADGRTQYYSKYFGSKGPINDRPVLHLSVTVKNIIKRYPDIVKFIEKNLINRITNKAINFENSFVKINLSPFSVSEGVNHDSVYRLNMYSKKDKTSRKYFVKTSKEKRFPSSNEFVANKIFEKFGINTIKPHIAYFNPELKSNFIIYDFTNLHSLSWSRSHGKITPSEYKSVLIKVKKLLKYSKEIGIGNFKVEGVGDFSRPSNIFVKKATDNKIHIYFTDLLIGLRVSYY
jgi:hypothetical protein